MSMIRSYNTIVLTDIFICRQKNNENCSLKKIISIDYSNTEEQKVSGIMCFFILQDSHICKIGQIHTFYRSVKAGC